MGTRGREIVGLDVEKLIVELNRALSDEWLAYYQYWIGSKVVVGPMRDAVVAELTEHANDELRHAGMLADRIMQLEGAPVLKPEEWYDMCNCGYDSPDDPAVRKILDQNIKGEQCAIDVYNKIMKMTEGKDPITYQMAFEIMRDEVEHEDDLQAIAEDIKGIK
ncbi:MAG: ferritin [Candidatus Altiarchaeales archaeon]|nr:ferritin [Candidatus Altiarchaeales archaeon]MBD3416397.1 ferritin [Candidatus Altiarchaeales archaeon]